MDLTLFLFDSRQQLRSVITQGIARCVHDERNHTLSAEIPIRHAARPGEYLGLACVDGRFRMFAIEYADEDDDTAMTAITATDAAVDELSGIIIDRKEAENVPAGEAVRAIIDAAGWTAGAFEAGDKTVSVRGGMVSAWDALNAEEKTNNLYMAPHFTFAGGRITGKTVDVLAKKSVYRGRLVERGSDASSIRISYGKRPRPMIYPTGADGLTIADVEWSKANGDPADKPKGQTWIAVPEAVEAYDERGQTYDAPDVTDAKELTRKAWEKAQEAAKPEITATAKIADMEMIAGQGWKKIRMFDLVRVRPKHGQDAEEQVIRIERDYVRNDETKITLGKEQDTSAKQVKGLMRSSALNARNLSANRLRLAETKTMLEDTNVRLYELDGYTRTEIGNVSVKLNAAEAAILLKASREDLAETDRTLNEVSVRLDAARAELVLKAEQSKVDGVESNLGSAIIRLSAAEGKIEAKADRIELEGYVTATRLATEIALLETAIAENLFVQSLGAKSFQTVNLKLGNDSVSKTKVNVVTSFTQASGETATATEVTILTTAAGSEATQNVAAGTTKTF